MKKIWMSVFSFVLLLVVFCANSSAQSSKASIKSGDLTNPSAIKLIDIVLASDPDIAKSNSEQRAEAFLKEKNTRIVDYLVARYPQYGVVDVDVNDPATTWFGLMCAWYELNQFQPLNDIQKQSITGQRIPQWLDCALGVLGSAYGVTELVSSLGSFSFGSTWTVVKFVVKKYVTGWLGTAVALYQISKECF